MAQNTFQDVELNSDIVWSWPFSLQTGPVIADINNVSTAQVKVPCYAATTANLDAIYDNGTSGVGATLTNNGAFAEFSVDSIAILLGSRILVKDQDPLSNANGIYTVTTLGDAISINWVLTRATDYDTVEEIQPGDFIAVTNGVVNALTQWTQTSTIVNVGISSPVFISINDGWSISLPDATLSNPGQNVRINNVGLYAFRLLASDGITLIVDIEPGEIYYLYLNDNSTTNGVWNAVALTDGSTGINSVIAESTDSSINISGSPLAPPGGVIDFTLPTSISNVLDINTPGFAVVTATGAALTWETRTLLGGSNIVVDDGDGVTANPNIGLNSSITVDAVNLTSGITIDGDTITNSVDSDINLTTTGTGEVSINGVIFNENGSLSGVDTPKVYFTFTDTLIPEDNTIVIEDQSHVTSIVGSNGIYTINFDSTLSSANYGLFLGLGSTGGPTPFVSHAFWTLRTTTSVVIAVVDASGVLVESVPNGITGMVMLAD